MDPCSPTEACAVLIWNSIALRHGQLSRHKFDSHDSCQAIFDILKDLSGLTALFSACVANCPHLLLNPQTAQFLSSYNQMIIAQWQSGAAICGRCSPFLIARICSLVHAKIDQVLMALPVCFRDLPLYFRPFLVPLSVYYASLSYLNLALHLAETNSFSQAASACREGLDQLTPIDIRIVPKPLDSIIAGLKSQLETTQREAASKDNRKYSEKQVLPEPAALVDKAVPTSSIIEMISKLPTNTPSRSASDFRPSSPAPIVTADQLQFSASVPNPPFWGTPESEQPHSPAPRLIQRPNSSPTGEVVLKPAPRHDESPPGISTSMKSLKDKRSSLARFTQELDTELFSKSVRGTVMPRVLRDNQEAPEVPITMSGD
jgi:hypothetical protein